MNILGCFKTHYSIGRSTLTAEKPKGNLTVYPVSIFDLAIQHKLETVCVIDDSISGFLQLNQGCIEHKLKLIYGLRLWVTEDCLDKKEENLKKRAKYIVFIKNNEGYKNLIKISSFACKDGFYYEPTIDFKHLKKFWNENNLKLAVPFYDSFLHLNALESHLHVPDFFVRPTFFVEDNDLPFDYLIKNRVEEYTKANNYNMVKSQTILYPKREDFISYLTIRAINSRSSLEKPNLNHMGSDTFSFESFLQKNSIK